MRRLARRCLARGVQGLAGVAGEGVLILLGTDLPWADGAVYLGRDPRAPGLLLPTLLSPDVPLDLLERAVARRMLLPVAWLPAPTALVSLASAGPVDPARLEHLAR